LRVSFPKRFLVGMAIISGLTKMGKTVTMQIRNNVLIKISRYFDEFEFNF
jgi:hypothetical protein